MTRKLVIAGETTHVRLPPHENQCQGRGSEAGRYSYSGPDPMYNPPPSLFVRGRVGMEEWKALLQKEQN